MLFALSICSISCSKLSKATILFASEMSGDWIAAMDSFIKSASEGPPISALSASALRLWLDDWGASRLAESVEVELEVEEGNEFSIPHLRRRFSPGSMMKVCRVKGD